MEQIRPFDKYFIGSLQGVNFQPPCSQRPSQGLAVRRSPREPGGV